MDLKNIKFSIINEPLKVTCEKAEIVVLYADIGNFWITDENLSNAAKSVWWAYALP